MKKSRIGSQCAFGDHDLCAMPQSCACQCHRGPAVSDEANIPDEVVKAVREAMRETMDSSIFGNSHDEPAEREYDMAEHVATAAQAALRKEWDEECNEAAVRQARIGLSWQRRALAAEAARARDAEALTTTTEALRNIAAQENCTYWHKKVLKWCAREARTALAAIDHSPTTAKRLATATDALKAIAAPEHRMPDDWAAMVAIAALKRIGEP